MLSKVWDIITYPFPNFKGATAEVWEWIGNFISHFLLAKGTLGLNKANFYSRLLCFYLFWNNRSIAYILGETHVFKRCQRIKAEVTLDKYDCAVKNLAYDFVRPDISVHTCHASPNNYQQQ